MRRRTILRASCLLLVLINQAITSGERRYLIRGSAPPVPQSNSSWQYPVTPWVPGSYKGRGFLAPSAKGAHLGEDEQEDEKTPVRAIGPGRLKWYRAATVPNTGYGE